MNDEEKYLLDRLYEESPGVWQYEVLGPQGFDVKGTYFASRPHENHASVLMRIQNQLKQANTRRSPNQTWQQWTWSDKRREETADAA